VSAVSAGFAVLALFAIIYAAVKYAQPKTPPETLPPDSNDSSRLIEQLMALRDKGALTDEEFQRKKAEILSRI
jgi:hypothetical protein